MGEWVGKGVCAWEQSQREAPGPAEQRTNRRSTKPLPFCTCRQKADISASGLRRNPSPQQQEYCLAIPGPVPQSGCWPLGALSLPSQGSPSCCHIVRSEDGQPRREQGRSWPQRAASSCVEASHVADLPARPGLPQEAPEPSEVSTGTREAPDGETSVLRPVS